MSSSTGDIDIDDIEYFHDDIVTDESFTQLFTVHPQASLKDDSKFFHQSSISYFQKNIIVRIHPSRKKVVLKSSIDIWDTSNLSKFIFLQKQNSAFNILNTDLFHYYIVCT